MVRTTDRELLTLIGDGDREAFRLLYDRYSDRLYRYAVLRLGDAATAEDVVQEVFLAVWIGADAYEGRSSVTTWLFGIAHNKVGEAVRGRARVGLLRGGPGDESDHDDGLVAGGEAGRAAVVTADARQDERLWVLGALRSLAEDDREVLFLAYYADLSTREMAAVCGIPEGTVKSRLFHARQRLAERLEPDRWDEGLRTVDRTGSGGDHHERT